MAVRGNALGFAVATLVLATMLSGDPSASAATGAGSRLSFTSDRAGGNDVYLIDADGTGERRLTRDAAEDGQASWSPDAQKLAFVSTRDGNTEVYVMDADGSGQRRLNA